MKKVILLVCMLCLALPMFANPQDDLVKYLVQEIETVNAQTSLKRLAQLTFAGKIIFGEGSRDPFFLLISMKMKPETRTIKEKSALYARMNFADPQMKQDALDVLFAGKEPVELTDQDEELKIIAEAMKDIIAILESSTDFDKSTDILNFLQEPTSLQQSAESTPLQQPAEPLFSHQPAESTVAWYLQNEWYSQHELDLQYGFEEYIYREKEEYVYEFLEQIGVANKIVNSQREASSKLSYAIAMWGHKLKNKMAEDYRTRLEEHYAPLTEQEIKQLDRILDADYWFKRTNLMYNYCWTSSMSNTFLSKSLQEFRETVEVKIRRLEEEIRKRLNVTDKPRVTAELMKNTEWTEWN